MVARDEHSFSLLIKRLLLCFAVPCALVAAIIVVSPNYSSATTGTFDDRQLRTDPLGGDLLQEFIGGHLWKTNREQLYDWKHSAQLQHDESLTGFAWEESGYFPMVYPPFHYQLASWTVDAGYWNFILIWMFVNALALGIASFVFLYGYKGRQVDSGRFLFLAIVFTPLLLGLNMGQKSAVLLGILTVTFVLLHNRKPFVAGLIFGLIAFKPYLAILIGLVMLLKAQYRFVAGALLTLSVAVATSWMASPDSWSEYIAVCVGMGDYLSNGGYQLSQSHSLWASAELLFGHWSPELVKPFTVVASIGVLTLLGRIMTGPVTLDSPRFSYQFSACMVATVLVSPHFYTYDLTILLLPLAICGMSTDLSNRIDKRVMNWICIAVLFGASLYGWIAANIGMQVSTLILFSWLVSIAGGWKAVDLLDHKAGSQIGSASCRLH